MPRAEYITCRGDQGLLLAVFGKDANYLELCEIADRMNESSKSLIFVGAHNVHDERRFTICARVPSIDEMGQIASNLRASTKPYLPFTISDAQVTLWTCTCGIVTPQARLTFIDGLGPENPASYNVMLKFQLYRLPIDQTFSNAPTPC